MARPGLYLTCQLRTASPLDAYLRVFIVVCYDKDLVLDGPAAEVWAGGSRRCQDSHEPRGRPQAMICSNHRLHCVFRDPVAAVGGLLTRRVGPGQPECGTAVPLI